MSFRHWKGRERRSRVRPRKSFREVRGVASAGRWRQRLRLDLSLEKRETGKPGREATGGGQVSISHVGWYSPVCRFFARYGRQVFLSVMKGRRSSDMGRSSTDSFVLTVPLRYEPWQRDRLDKIFRVAGTIYNNLVSDQKRALAELERTRAWRSNKKAIKAAYDAADKAALRDLFRERREMLMVYGFTEYGFYVRVKKWRKPYSLLVGSDVARGIAFSVWKQFEAYFYGKGERISFKPWTEFRSIEGKSNDANIRYKGGMVMIGKQLSVRVVQPRDDYQREALSCRVKYCRIIRLPWKDGQWLYKLQLVLEGAPPVKRDGSGHELHPIGSGRTGIDIGTQTVAAVGDDAAELSELAPGIDRFGKKLDRIMRKMDRSRRAMNPAFFNQDTGEVIRRDKLPPGSLDGRGRRKWVESKAYKRLAGQRRYLFAKLARARKCAHQEMANRIVSYGNEFYVETMSFKGLARKARRQPPESGKREKRRKRFGKSIGNKAPAMFIDVLERKVQDKGGSFHRIDTWSAKASQYDHTNGTYEKKPLGKRWADLSDGSRVQRDLYSAYLLKCTNESLDGFMQDLLEDGFGRFMGLHDEEIKRLSYIHTPGSTGVKCKAV